MKTANNSRRMKTIFGGMLMLALSVGASGSARAVDAAPAAPSPAMAAPPPMPAMGSPPAPLAQPANGKPSRFSDSGCPIWSHRDDNKLDRGYEGN